MNTRIPLILILLFLFPCLLLGQNEIQRERSSLRGISELGFTVNLETNVSLNKKGELEVTSLQDAVRKKLSELNVAILKDKEVRSSADIPFLYMHINTMDAGQGLVPFAITLHFYQPVKLTLNRDQQTSASTWESDMVGMVSYDRMNFIQDAAVGLMQDFIDDFRQVNL